MSSVKWFALAFLAGLVLAYYGYFGLTKPQTENQKAQQQLDESPKNAQTVPY